MALELAVAADRDVTHMLCSLVVSKNRILSVGYNSSKTHSISKDTKKQQLHAEMEAVVRCPDKDLRGSVVIVVRSRPSGRPGLARPCETCQGVLRRFGVRRVLYTINSEDAKSPELYELKL